MIDPAYWGPWGVPATALSYGESGDGKTVDMGYAFHRLALWVGTVKHLKSISGVCGIPFGELARCEVSLVSEIRPLIAHAAQQGYLAVGIDDLSLLASASFAYHDSHAPIGRSGAKDGFYAHQEVEKDLLGMRDEAKAVGIHVIWNAHLVGADTDGKGRSFKGGPKMPNRNLRAVVPVIADVTLKCSKDPMRQRGWKGIYECDESSTAWYMRDRHHVAPRTGPMNLAEILREAGYLLPYPPELAWAAGADQLGLPDSLIDQATMELRAHGPAAWSQLRMTLEAQGTAAGAPPWAIAWAERDILDRAAIRRQRADSRLAMFA